MFLQWAIVPFLVSLLQHKVYCGIMLHAAKEPKVTRPNWTLDDLRNKHWSNASTTLHRKALEYVYANYTIDDNIVRFTELRVAPVEQQLERRGYYKSANSYKWDETNARLDSWTGIVYVRLCYDSEETRALVNTAMEEATGRWHSVLTCYGGIRISILGGLCADPHRNVWVTMHTDQNAPALSTIGAKPLPEGLNQPDHYIKLPHPRTYPEADGYTFIDMLTHELGHTLGLMHEHERYDARTAGLFIDCPRIPGYATVQNIVTTQRPRWPQGSLYNYAGHYITMDHLCTYGELSKDANLPFKAIWQGQNYIPEYSDAASGRNMLGQPYEQSLSGAFDWGSIMLYDTGRAGAVIWDARSGQNVPVRGPPPGFPLAGDVQAVKALYPNVLSPWT